MPTAPSSTETWSRARAAWRAVVDVRHLLWFRSAAIRRKSVARWVTAVFAVITLGVATVPAFLAGAGDLTTASDRATQFLILLPSALAGLLILAIVSSVASGGGRELLSREHGVAYPVSPTTDHLGALLFAPLNIAWLLQTWMLLGVTAYALGPRWLIGADLIALLWVASVTAIGQAVAWTVETVRRGWQGVVIVRLLGLFVGAVAVVIQLSGHVTDVLDALPTTQIMRGMVAAREGDWLRWLVTTAALLVLFAVAVVIGALPAHAAARLAPRDEIRAETGSRQARRRPRSDLAALMRIDRASVWRSVPMRRGLMVLAIGPGLVALAGNLAWETMTILPGLVASGAALLFGVNAWVLDGRGMLWRESLPASPGTVFAARVVVLGEWLFVASGATLVLASLRAGLPAPHELTALLSTLVVVTVQVVSASMRWSLARPFSVDMRSARATPAPPIVMVGYSARLALSTTLTGLVFSGLARLPIWNLSLAVAVPFLIWSSVRLMWVRQEWVEPVERARVTMTVAA
ncbi:MAG: hypothetical protein KDB63_00230 [Nocardioidaceae bacterium]|nr:hypothetical protein [Nocardioidaceae bacterium]